MQWCCEALSRLAAAGWQVCNSGGQYIQQESTVSDQRADSKGGVWQAVTLLIPTISLIRPPLFVDGHRLESYAELPNDVNILYHSSTT